MATRNGVTTSWFSYNLPNKVSQAATIWSQFSYTPTRQRWKQQIYNAGNAETWYYIGGLLEKRYITSTNMEYRHQIKVGNTTVAIYKRPTLGAVWLYYLSHDHLGSTNVIMNGVGAALVDESFAAFGSRRGSTWTGVPTAGDNTQIGATTRHGFTDHEHMDHLSLIHMNGRMFDPVIGRFMSAHPYVQDQTLTQSFNRYSYSGADARQFGPRWGACCCWVCWRGGAGGNSADRCSIERRTGCCWCYDRRCNRCGRSRWWECKWRDCWRDGRWALFRCGSAEFCFWSYWWNRIRIRSQQSSYGHHLR